MKTERNIKIREEYKNGGTSFRILGEKYRVSAMRIHRIVKPEFYNGTKRRRQRGSKSWRQMLLRKYDQCALCGSKENLEVDHIKRLRDGGETKMDNLQLLCKRCNRAKG